MIGREYKKKCEIFYVFNSDNDPYVPLSKGEELAKKVHGKLVVVPGAKHFNSEAGYKQFPLLLEHIKKHS